MNYENRVFGYVYTDMENGYIPYEDIEIIKRNFNINNRDMFLDRGNRSVFNAMIKYILCVGDILAIRNIQSLGTNKKFILKQLEYLYCNGIGVYFVENPELNVNLDINKKLELVRNTLLKIERDKKRNATIAGINRMPINEYGTKYSKRTSKEIGRPTIKIPKNFDDIYMAWKNRKISSNDAIKQSGLKKSTFYSIVKAYESLHRYK